MLEVLRGVAVVLCSELGSGIRFFAMRKRSIHPTSTGTIGRVGNVGHCSRNPSMITTKATYCG